MNCEQCISFHVDIPGMPKLFEKEKLCCLEFGESYLMVEVDNEYVGVESKGNPVQTYLRMNVQKCQILG